MKAAERDRIAELEGLIQGYKNSIECTLFDLAHPQRVLNEIDRCKKSIASLQAQVERYEKVLSHGAELVEHMRVRATALRQEVTQLKAADKIAKLLELQALLNEEAKQDENAD